MSTLKYVRLVNVGATLDKKFRVLYQDYRTPILRRINVKEMADGSLDIQHGAHYRVWSLALKIYVTESGAGYGNLSDIQTFFGYKTPATHLLTFYDNLGVQFTVVMANDYDPLHQTSNIDGPENWAIVPILLRRTTQE